MNPGTLSNEDLIKKLLSSVQDNCETVAQGASKVVSTPAEEQRELLSFMKARTRMNMTLLNICASRIAKSGKVRVSNVKRSPVEVVLSDLKGRCATLRDAAAELRDLPLEKRREIHGLMKPQAQLVVRLLDDYAAKGGLR